MKNRKRILSLALAAVMALALVPAAALAAEEAPERGVLTYEEIIAPQYEAAQPFSEGLAAVKKDGKWGYIDKTGAVVIPFQYDRAYVFNEGYAIVGKFLRTEENTDWVWDEEAEEGSEIPNGTYSYWYELGFIDKENNLTWFEETYYDWEDRYVTRTYQMVFSDQDDYNSYDLVFHNGYIIFLWNYEPGGYIFDTTGKDVSTVDCPHAWPVNEDMVIGGILGGSNSLSYYNIVTEETVEVDNPLDEEEGVYLRPFNQGLAPAAPTTGSYDEELDEYVWESLWGFIDKQGQWVIQPQYTDFIVSGETTDHQVFGETGLATVEKDDKWGAIDKKDNTVIPFEYDWLWPYHFGLCAFQKDGKWGYLDEKGNVALPAQYEDTSGFSGNGYAVVYDGVKVYLIDSKGNPIPGADSLDPDTYFRSNENGSKRCLTPAEYVVIEENGKYGYGHISYTPPLPEAEDMSGWAYEEVTAAIEEDLVPRYLQNLYRRSITRAEFCDLIVQLVEEVTGKSIDAVVLEKTGKGLDEWRRGYPFRDTTSSHVIAANALKIVDGRGDRVFDPYTTITRQEAAALLMRGAAALGMDTSAAQNAGFADGNKMSSWAVDAINFVNQINVMTGTGNNQFSPLDNYSREQSYMTMHRLFQNVAGK